MNNTKVTLAPLEAGDREQFILDNAAYKRENPHSSHVAFDSEYQPAPHVDGNCSGF